MKTLEFNQSAGDDRVLRLNIPVESPGESYHVVVHIEPTAGNNESEFLSDDFINETAGKWVGDFAIESESDYEERERL